GEDTARESALTLPLAHATGSNWTPFSVDVTPPSWAKRVEVVLVGRGSGSVLVDDLALVPTGAPPAGAKLGELTVVARAPGSYALDHQAPLIEFFAPSGSVARAGGERSELASPAFGAEVRGEGTTFTLEP